MKKVLFLSIISLVLGLCAGYAAMKLYNKAKQKNGTPRTETVYQIVRDTVFIDRSRPINKPWYSYEIESGEDSIYLYSGRELIGVVGRKGATVFYIDSLIIADNL